MATVGRKQIFDYRGDDVRLCLQSTTTQTHPLCNHAAKPHNTSLLHDSPDVTINTRMPTTLQRHDNHGSSAHIMTTGATQAQTNANYLVQRHPPLCPTDGDAIIPKPKGKEPGADMQDGQSRKVDKKSPEYLLKSLIAGGIAGCAVR